MNLNSKTIRVLCYGDSNTWGRIPGQKGKRYPVNVRWTGLLQKKLGEGYSIIEEGLGGRTTTLDDPQRADRNGKTYLRPCLETHNPLDIIILMLGVNDLKERFRKTPEQVAQGIGELLEVIQLHATNNQEEASKVIVVSPPYVDETVPDTMEIYKGAYEKSKKLASEYQKITDQYNATLVDLGARVPSSKIDGYHLDPEAHTTIAEILFNTVQETPGI